MLRSADAHYRQQQRYVLVGLAAARRAWGLGSPASATRALILLQTYAARDATASVGDMLSEQGVNAPPEAAVNTAAVATDIRPPLAEAADLRRLESMVVSAIGDTARVAAGVAITTRDRVGWVRMVNAPCCPRCAIQAGKWFAWNQGFLRHPNCGCRHIPARENVAGDVRTDPEALFASGQIRGLTKIEQAAIEDGANMGRVVNGRESLYMTLPGSARLHAVYRRAGDDRTEALSLLQQAGYII